MRASDDLPWELILDPDRDEILLCARLNRPVMVEGHLYPFDAKDYVLTVENMQLHRGTWRVEVWAPTEAEAKRGVAAAMAKRRAEVGVRPDPRLVAR